jgi:glycogen phosphorylase
MRTHRFDVLPNLPDELKPLDEMARDLWYSWHRDAAELFARLDPDAWQASGRNPVMTLAKVPQATLDAAARDETFLAELRRIHTAFRTYQAGTGWFDETYPGVNDLQIAYFSLEFGLDTALPIYSGGLGILAGDHLKSASDLGLPLVGVGLLYGNGYFRQALNIDGWQQELYPPNDWSNMPVHRHVGDDGEQLHVDVVMAGTPVRAAIWRAQVGRVPLYLLDTNIEANPPELRDITASLYGGDRERRVRQELLLGIGGARALQAVGIAPTVFHMNEGHSAFLALERLRVLMHEHALPLPAALEQVTGSTVFTTHTPVPAGNEVFDVELVRPYLEPVAADLGLTWDALVDMGQAPGQDDSQFGMTPLALRTAAFANGVSKLHGEVSRGMWQSLWPQLPVDEVPISSVTNGIHPRTWLSREMGQLLDRYLGPRLVESPQDQSVWERVDKIPPGELWRVKQRRRERLVLVTRERLREQMERRGASRAALREADETLRPDILTLGFARRFATYKRATLLFRQADRLARLLTDPDRPVQLVFSGKAHPADTPGKELIQAIVRFAQDPRVRQRIVFVEDYDMGVSRLLVSGCDVWLNAPRRPLEASGTSGMKAVVNGVLNVSVPDGWWDEGYTPEVGWSIGNRESYDNEEEQDAIECDALFNLLEQEVIPLFYRRDASGLPREWVARMTASMSRLGAVFNTHRMVQEYAEWGYLPAHRAATRLAKDAHGEARALATWRDRVAAVWPEVTLRSQVDAEQNPIVGTTIPVSVWAGLAGLAPDEVTVEVAAGLPDASGMPAHPSYVPAQHSGTDGNEERYSAEVPCTTSGPLTLAVRIRPRNPSAVNALTPLLLTWE